MNNFITLRGASVMASCSTSTIRRWIKKNLVEARTDKNGHWIVNESSLRLHLQTSGASMEAPLTGYGSSDANNIEEVKPSRSLHDDFIKQLRDDLERERQLHDETRQELKAMMEEKRALFHEFSAFMKNKTDSGLLSRFSNKILNSK